MTATGRLPILLLEPSAVLRQTVALTAISTGAASVWQASHVRMAEDMLGSQPFAGAVVAVDPTDDGDDHALAVIASIRAGRSTSSADIPVYVLVTACPESLLARLSALHVQRILIKPFKARVLIDVLSSIYVMPTKIIQPVPAPVSG